MSDNGKWISRTLPYRVVPGRPGGKEVMKNSKPRVVRKEDSEEFLGVVSVESGVPKQRLRGMAMEYAEQSGEQFRQFVKEREE